MTMTFSLNDDNAPGSGFADIGIDAGSFSQDCGGRGHSSDQGDPFLIQDKLRIPDIDDAVARPRLIELLDRSRTRYPASLISGRAGTGKTTLAALFTRSVDHSSWFSVEAADTNWDTFARYFSAFASWPEIRRNGARKAKNDASRRKVPSTDEIAGFLLDTFARPARSAPGLLVMDDVHHLFDVKWFEEFFSLLIYSLPDDLHLLMLCRSRPGAPLWRLRSKQMLNVIDERIIAFDESESQQLLKKYGLDTAAAAHMCSESFGRVGKLRERIEELKRSNK